MLKNNSQFYDLTHGAHGYMVWLLPFIFAFFCFPLFLNIWFLFSNAPTFSETYILLWMIIFWLTALVIWFGSSIIYALKTVQCINFENNKISLTLYYCKKINLKPCEIEEVNEFKITRLMSQTRTFPQGGIGIKIYLKSGKNYLISPNMDGFNEVKCILISA